MTAAASPAEQADANQARASDPAASAWVSANAGTGKTAVLVKRVLLLLLAGSRPEAILCLTYTKTAAAEMQNRLLGVLSDWATLPREDLDRRLHALLRREPNVEERRIARRLFARALEARGGLKIHTIHGFCERLLQRFPLEAGVTPHFSVLDEHGAARLKREAYDAALARAAQERDSALGQALAKAITFTSDDYFRKVVETVLAKRAELVRMVAYHESAADWAEAESKALKRRFGVAEEEEAGLIEALAGVLTDDEIDAALAAFAADGSTDTDGKIEASLREARSNQGEARAAALRSVFIKGDGAPRARTCGSVLAKAAPDIAGVLDAAKDCYAALNDKLAHLRVAEASAAVLVFADAVSADYERRKRAEAVLDYDGLIAKALALLSRPGAAAWVLYKIDGGIDHILVDEAQDTNPAQWQIVERVAAEFFAGVGASDKTRTVFAVGDEKQSIYSFQGADPSRFGSIGRDFRQRAVAIGTMWHEVPLNLSFRSTDPILKAVDAVFAQPEARKGLIFSETAVIQHYAHRQGQAGLVEIWGPERETKAEPVEAFEPWNEEASGANSVNRLCKRIAETIKRWLDEGEVLPSRGRNVRAGDILILVRRRDPFTTPMIRALKHLHIPVSGADRMTLMDQLAVQDLVALADVLLLPEDDLSLAVVLKSPFFNLGDDALFDLAYRRPGSLWSALEAKTDPRFAEAEQRLTAWRARVDLLAPYEFFSEVLGAGNQQMRKRVLTRLGPEAAEAIDEFLDLALRYDRDAAPSLQGFVDWLRMSAIEIKRDMDQERNEVRIMTVHGAKGLEAPIVFLPDTCMRPRPQGPRIFPLPRAGEAPDEVGHIVWPPAKHANLAGLSAAKAAVEQAESEEHNRLLYVAMTRASDRLYVCGWTGQRDKPEANSWHPMIEAGLAGLLAEIGGPDGIAVRRMQSAQEMPVEGPEAAAGRPKPPPLPDWALRRAAPERPSPRLAPSRLALVSEEGGEPEQPPLGPLALSEHRRYARGRLVHALLQHLPEVRPESQEAVARAFVAARGVGLPEALQDEIVSECLAVVRDIRFAPLFQPGSLAEIPVVARIGDGDMTFELEGQIDRLVEHGSDLLILDYKTNRPPPETPQQVAPAYVAQLAAYRLALARLFPGRTVRAALVWTDGPKLMEIPKAMLDAAECRLLRQGASLDAIERRT